MHVMRFSRRARRENAVNVAVMDPNYAYYQQQQQQPGMPPPGSGGRSRGQPPPPPQRTMSAPYGQPVAPGQPPIPPHPGIFLLILIHIYMI